MNSIIISINVNINEKKDEISFEKSSLIEMKDLLTNQLFSEFSAAISAEISSTFDLLIMRVSSATKSVLMVLCHFFCRAVRTVLKNIDSSNSVILNSVFQTVRIILLANQASAISDSDSQAVKVASPAHRSCSQSQKNEVASIIQQV